MIKVYNTLTGKKEDFETIHPGKVNMYVCGLTVQNYSHIGHIRSAINYDVIRRYLEYRGYDVTYVQNFTDINEKIIARAEEEGLKPLELAEKYTKAYLDDISQLNIKDADYYCNATDHISDILDMVKTLIDKGYAYEANGSVYYSVEKFKDYGKLSGRNISGMKAGSRVEISDEKKDPMDFAIWKNAEDEEIYWESPWGKGWPGWHIECSAMSMKYLGDSFDIHGGGTDLIFPHHENEIAQSEAYSGEKPFVKYWLHNGTVNLKGEKMSKSLGNVYSSRELLKDYSTDVLRYFLLTKHYHSPIDFSLEELNKIKVSVERLFNTKRNLENLLEKKFDQKMKKDFLNDEFIDILKDKREKFESAMDDDFNTALAIGVLHEFSKEINKFINNPEFEFTQTSKNLLQEADRLYKKLTGVMGLSLEAKKDNRENIDLSNNLIDYILEIREDARNNKNWKLADDIRDKLKEFGVEIKDTSFGVEWEFAKGDGNGKET